MSASMIIRVAAVVSIAVLSLAAADRPAEPAISYVTLTGTLSCAHCQGIQPMHKGYTQFSWALHSVNLGDDIVLLVQDKIYTLQGDKSQLLPFMSTKARVTGELDGSTMDVRGIHRAVTNE
jgi:hypothetical protein